MPAGLQVFDASGNLVTNITDRIGRVLGTIETGTSNGSVTGVSGFSTGTPFKMCVTLSGLGYYMPTVTISGTTLSWTFPSGGQSECIIVYGVY